MTVKDKPEPVRALSLLSGGLDSQLAVCVLKEQGVDVHGVTFDSPFFSIASARAAAPQLGVPLHIVDFSRDILELLEAPPHGFGSRMNPCIDCHARMLRRAGEMMDEMGFHFLSTGEVLNQRPMSQNSRSLETVAATSGYPGRIVRPLSAALLPETEPERSGWLDRSKLLSLQGRARNPQFELARKYGLKDYPSPAGGCRLTEPNFCRRLADLKEHEGLGELHSIHLLRYGRHFRLAPDFKLIVGRNEKDNAALEENAERSHVVLEMVDIPGPTGLLPMCAGERELSLAAAICARYSDCSPGEPVAVRVTSARGERLLEVVPARHEDIEGLRV
jgi:tRNA-uridine 2-sulfurtransferase